MNLEFNHANTPAVSESYSVREAWQASPGNVFGHSVGQ